MKFIINQIIIVLCTTFLVAACNSKSSNSQDQVEEKEGLEEGHDHNENESENVHLSLAQFKALDMQVGAIPRKNLSNIVEANGELEVPPKNEAAVTAILGANISSIEVIEGDDVQKGQVLAYLSHPNIIELQGSYLESFNRKIFLEQEYNRQQKLYEEEVGSGKAFQQISADYRSAEATVKSYEAQLRQLRILPEKIQKGDFYNRIPVLSPIKGSITKVEVKTGQYVQPEKNLFEIVNIDNIHADLMVFENDVYKVNEGQRVRFTVETMPGKELYAEIYSVGKKFEQDPKAVHVHAEIENVLGKLIPGMYVRGEILTDSVTSLALPESAITREGDDYLTFTATEEGEEWMFTPLRVSTGTKSNGWVAVKFLDAVPENAQFALNNAYYLIAEMKKGEGGHHH
ncbi:efflux RND transporter periplasmic adaptor subunit [Cyclobacterium plantarum]|uniref:Efflux RND transporter periplasmic adaptor subunit n=1 Tax=Cyclobacterium plantarum TaxID=2716263 RepID=A0ABX0H4A8_9BACT|nr:efflux RND transporter periplasmic adaptor subunit [Cyclobacterium plantarum]NHE56669.1 efflux RND transporter periplasmic adaptor subunit [Cyclobacterium plantarum]